MATIDDGELIETLFRRGIEIENGILKGENLSGEVEIDMNEGHYVLFPGYATAAREDMVIEIWEVEE